MNCLVHPTPLNLRSRCAWTKAFNLVELVVVIGILSALTALMLPAVSRSKSASKSVACKNNLRQLGIALALYVGDAESYPLVCEGNPGPGIAFHMWYDRLVPYASGNWGALNCPAAPLVFWITNSPAWPSSRRLSYGYNAEGTAIVDPPAHLGLGMAVNGQPGYSYPNGKPFDSSAPETVTTRLVRPLTAPPARLASITQASDIQVT